MSKTVKQILIFISLTIVFQCFSDFCFSQDNKDFYKRLIIIGDAGSFYDGQSVVVNALTKHIPQSDSNTTLIFAGDNIYPHGLPETDNFLYEKSVKILEAQLLPFREYSSKIIMIPGNHDWERSGPGGWEFVKRQGEWVDSLKAKNIIYFPKSGCPGPVEIKISDNIVLVVIDTQWWLHTFEKPGLDSDCNCKTKDEVVAKIRDIAYRNRDNKIVLAAHHPFRSYGIHGGYYTIKQHIFPLTDLSPDLYIPFPILGSLYPISRGIFGNIQDIPHPLNKEMVQQIEEAISAAPDVTFVSGHDHNLQLIADKNYEYIVSGSGIKTERVKKGKKSLFAADKRGFAEIRFFKDGTQKTLMYEVTDDEKLNLMFTYTHPDTKRIPPLQADVTKPVSDDSISIAIAPEYDNVSSLHRFLFGKNYRKIWATPVTVKVFRIEEEKGGLTILQRGGGMQIKSLRLRDSTGKEWVLRTIGKNPEKALPYNLREAAAKKIIQDQISASLPFAALVVPPLAEALNIPHSTPEIVYVAPSPALGIYNLDFANTVCILEGREPGDSEKTHSTSDVLEKLEKDNINQVNQKAVLTARLLDLLLGDWDRHENQWLWQKEEIEGKNYFQPIPRDHDQAFFINSGLLPSIASRKWLIPKFQGFDKEVRDVNGFMYNARFFDRIFLNELQKEDWDSISKAVQQKLTDAIITRAVKQLPENIYKKSGAEITENLIHRRNNLRKEALKYYAFLSKNVNIALSDEQEFVEVNNQDKGNLMVTVIGLKGEERESAILYKRTFSPDETKEIRIYGRDGKDVFSITGDTGLKIKVRMIGGSGKDSSYVDPALKSKGKLIVYDRKNTENKLPERNRITQKLSEKSAVNKYNPRSFKYNVLRPLAGMALNLDDGLILAGGFQYVKHGFRKEPFAEKHEFLSGHSFGTSSWFINYSSEFKNFIGRNNLLLNINSLAPTNTSNFFGVGNETAFLKTNENSSINYYRTRYNVITANALLERQFVEYVKIFGGLKGQYYNLPQDENKGRFIKEYNPMPDESVFSTKFYAGLTGGFEIDTRSNVIFPTNGVHWVTNLTALQQINGGGKRLGQLTSELAFHASFRSNPRFVISNRLGAGTTFGDPSFFQLMYLGGKQHLRGYRNYRFAGHQMFYHNIEVRFKLFDFASYLFPGSVGLIAFNDVGRVWSKYESSGKWHDGYGGGIYIIPVELLLFNTLIGFSEEGILPYISLGLKF